MLIEIMCDKFISHGMTRGKISLHPGLNTVIGSNSGSNSIGKSTFLMIIDFIFGGDDYVEKLEDVQTEVGPHRICFAFKFQDGIHYFSRSNVEYKIVHKCNSDYSYQEDNELSLNQYLSFLLLHYNMELPRLTFRNAVGRSMRIYKRETLDEEHPLHQAKKETDKNAIEGLLKLTDLYSGIERQSKIATEAEDRYNTFKKAQKYQYVPTVTKQTEYENNKLRIIELNEQAKELIRKSSGGLLDLNSMQAERLSELQGRLSTFKRERTQISAQLHAIQLDQDLGKKGFKRDYNDLLYFFPNVDLQRIEAIESFHKQLAGILKKEFTETEENMQATLDLVQKEIDIIEESIIDIAKETDLSKVILERYAEVDKELRTLKAANESFEKATELSITAKSYKKELDRLVIEQISIMNDKINEELNRINNIIYNGKKTSPTLKVMNATHYEYHTPKDGGTGSQYKGLVVFDLALLELTSLPVIAHDSVLLKHIEDDAIEKILELYSNSPKQIFIAMDKEGSYTKKAQEIMERSKVLQLSPGEGTLFGRAWNNV